MRRGRKGRGALLTSVVYVVACSSTESPEFPRPNVASSTEEATHSPALSTPTARQRGYVGVIAAQGSMDLAARVEGVVLDIHASLGEIVEPGAPLATIDVPGLEQEVEVARAMLRSAQAAVQTAVVEVEEQRRLVDVERKLLQKGNTTKEALAQTEYAHRRAVTTLKAARSQMSEARAQLATIEEKLESARIVAPQSGKISAIYRDVGASVASGTPVVRLLAGEPDLVKFAILPEEAEHMGPGSSVDVEIPSAGVQLSATVRQVAPELDPASGMFMAEAHLDAEAVQATVRTWNAGAVVRVYRK